MKRFMLLTLVLFILVAMLLVACSGQSASPTTNSTIETTDSATIAESASETTDLVSCAASGEETTEIATARLYIEYNATDGDLGVHGAFDDDGWSVLCVYAPNGDQLLGVQPQSQLGDLTMAGIFFESREPELDEFSFDNLVARFPEGEYTVRGQSFDGTILTGAALFTHDIPAEPAITAPTLAEDEESAAEATIPLDNLVVSWEDVTETANGDLVTITSYEVIVTKVDHNDPHGFSRPIYDVHVPAGLNSLSVPAEFLEPGTIYELEVLALEGSGNQTISVGFFKTGG